MRTSLVLLCLVPVLACEKTETTGGEAPTQAVAPEWKQVGGLGIEAQVWQDTRIDDKTASAKFPSVTIWASPTVFVTGKNDVFWPADAEKAKEEAKSDPNKFQSFTLDKATASGFHLEYTLESLMDKAPIYGVKIRETVGGNPFDCGGNAKSETERKKIVAICQSLRASK